MIWNLVTRSPSCYVNDSQVVVKDNDKDMGLLLVKYSHPLLQWWKQTKRSKAARRRFKKALTSVRFISGLRFSESYFAVKGAALILPQSEFPRTASKPSDGGDIGNHLQCMFYLLRPQDTIKVAVKLESSFPTHNRYLAVVCTDGRQDTEESVILGIDVIDEKSTIGLILPIWGDSSITLDGDGGFSVTSNEKHHIFKPVSVQAMWSALQSLIKCRDTAFRNRYFPRGLTHTWTTYYEVRLNSDQTCLNEWNFMEDIESHRPEIITETTEKVQLEKTIKATLKEVMMTVDLEEVTSKALRESLEKEMGMVLKEYKQFIDEEMIVILRQMDAPSLIFDHVYLGSEWNASNLEELRANGVGYILNVTREIDNFYPGSFEYMNIRLYDIPQSELLKHWDNTYKFIAKAKRNHSKVLVHCKMGISRSASTVIAYAMKEFNWTLDQAFETVKKKRSVIRPNAGFMQQLVTYQGILDASMQRHNQIWRSKSTSNLESILTNRDTETETSLNAELFDTLKDIPQSDPSRPRSWSPEDSTTRLLLKTQDFASDGESSEADTQTNSMDTATDDDFYDIDVTSNMTPFVDWDDLADLEMSSKSDDCLDDVFPSDGLCDSPGKLNKTKEPPVVLLAYKDISDKVSESEEEEEACGLVQDSDPDLGVDHDEVKYRRERGFYDVGMLNADLMSLSNETLHRVLGDSDHMNYLLHPDVKIEVLMAEQRKHMRIAQLLKLSQPPAEPPHPLQVVRPPDDTTSTEMPVPPNTPRLAKLKPDHCWIKEIPNSPDVVSRDSDPNSREDELPLVNTTENPDIENTGISSKNLTEEQVSLSRKEISVSSFHSEKETNSNDTQSPNEDIIVGREIRCDNVSASDDVSESGSDVGRNDQAVAQHYIKEDIPWNPGTVKRHKLDLEQKIKEELSVSPKSNRERTTSISSSSSNGDSVFDSNEEAGPTEPATLVVQLATTETVKCDEVNKDVEDCHLTTPKITVIEATPDREMLSSLGVSEEQHIKSRSEQEVPSETTEGKKKNCRRSYIYESEDILLEPGLVRRTRHEIELRQRSVSPGKDSKPVQRSSSLKTERSSHRKDRNSERRKTCLPLMSPSPSKDDLRKGFNFERRESDGLVSLLQDTERRRSSSDVSNDTFVTDKQSNELNSTQHQSNEDIKEKEEREIAKKKDDLIALKIGPEIVELKAGIVQKWKRDFEVIETSKSGSSNEEHKSLQREASPAELNETSANVAHSKSPVSSPARSGSGEKATPVDGSQRKDETSDVDTVEISSNIQDNKNIGEDDKNGPPTRSEFPQVGMVLRQAQELERRGSEKREKSPCVKVIKKDNQKITQDTGTESQLVGHDDSKIGTSERPVGSKSDAEIQGKSVESVEVETLVKVSTQKSPSSSPDITGSDPTDVAVNQQGSESRELVDTKTEPCKQAGERIPAYREEDITWSVGTVKQHKKAIESLVQEQTTPHLRKDSFSDSKYRMNRETLKLIQDIGSIILNSPEPKGTESGQGLVHRVTRDIELKSKLPSVRKRLLSAGKKPTDSAKTNQSKISHLDISTCPADSVDMDPLPRPRSPNIHSIEVKSVAIPKEISPKAVSKDVGYSSEVSKQRSKLSPAEVSDDKLINEGHVEISSGITEDGSATDCKGENEKRTSTWDEVKVKDLVGIFESKEEVGPTQGTSVTSPSDGMSELGLTFQRSDKTSMSEEACQTRPKRHTWTGDEERSSGFKIESDKVKDHGGSNGHKRHSSTDSTRTIFGKHSQSKLEDTSNLETDCNSFKNYSNVKEDEKNDQTEGKTACAETHRTRTVSEPPRKVLALKSNTKATSGLEKSSAERKISLPTKINPSEDSLADKQKLKEQVDKNVASHSSLLRRPKSAGHEGSKSARSVSAYELKSSHPPSPLAREAVPSEAEASRVGRPTSCSGASPVHISTQREPDPSNAPKRVRKQHGKTHPLARLTAGQEGGRDGQSGRSANPFYNTM